MDIFFHGFVGAIAGKATRKKQKKEPEKWTFKKMFPWIAWGMFPDAIAFVPTMILGLVTGGLGTFGPHSVQEYSGAVGIAHSIYNFSHSFVIFFAIFIAVRLIRGKWPLMMIGWPLHILVDIPLHANDFFPTPIFFPISNAHFTHGIHWGYPPVFFGLWAIAIIIFFVLSKKKKTIPQEISTEKEVQ